MCATPPDKITISSRVKPFLANKFVSSSKLCVGAGKFPGTSDAFEMRPSFRPFNTGQNGPPTFSQEAIEKHD